MCEKRGLTKYLIITLLLIGLGMECLVFYRCKDSGKIFWSLYFAIQIAIWISLAYVLRKLFVLTYRDELTNLWNRRYLHIKICREISKVSEDNFLSLAILDIDNFKDVNDESGHIFGDAVLKELAHILQKNIRRSDIVGRWGGEEFIIILPNTDERGAKTVCERIRQIIANYKFGCPITISAGLVTTTKSVDAAELIDRADCALYEAKKTKKYDSHILNDFLIPTTDTYRAIQIL